ncbi:MAG: hypothetical protein ACI4QF_02975 [Kiritimatiellia bacterium]
MNQLTETERQQLADAFDALMGVASEYGPEFFDSYHKRKGDGLFGELEKIGSWEQCEKWPDVG